MRPTDVRRRPEQVQRFLEPDQFKLYQLIWQRFIASQMADAVFDQVSVDIDAKAPAQPDPSQLLLAAGLAALAALPFARRARSLA